MVDGGEVQKLADMGFLLQRDGRLTVRPKGMPLLDALLPRIISDLLRT